MDRRQAAASGKRASTQSGRPAPPAAPGALTTCLQTTSIPAHAGQACRAVAAPAGPACAVGDDRDSMVAALGAQLDPELHLRRGGATGPRRARERLSPPAQQLQQQHDPQQTVHDHPQPHDHPWRAGYEPLDAGFDVMDMSYDRLSYDDEDELPYGDQRLDRVRRLLEGWQQAGPPGPGPHNGLGNGVPQPGTVEDQSSCALLVPRRRPARRAGGSSGSATGPGRGGGPGAALEDTDAPTLSLPTGRGGAAPGPSRSGSVHEASGPPEEGRGMDGDGSRDRGVGTGGAVLVPVWDRQPWTQPAAVSQPQGWDGGQLLAWDDGPVPAGAQTVPSGLPLAPWPRLGGGTAWGGVDCRWVELQQSEMEEEDGEGEGPLGLLRVGTEGERERALRGAYAGWDVQQHQQGTDEADMEKEEGVWSQGWLGAYAVAGERPVSGGARGAAAGSEDGLWDEQLGLLRGRVRRGKDAVGPARQQQHLLPAERQGGGAMGAWQAESVPLAVDPHMVEHGQVSPAAAAFLDIDEDEQDQLLGDAARLSSSSSRLASDAPVRSRVLQLLPSPSAHALASTAAIEIASSNSVEGRRGVRSREDPAKRLTRAIGSCRTWRQLQTLYDTYGGRMNAVHLTAMLGAVSHMELPRAPRAAASGAGAGAQAVGVAGQAGAGAAAGTAAGVGALGAEDSEAGGTGSWRGGSTREMLELQAFLQRLQAAFAQHLDATWSQPSDSQQQLQQHAVQAQRPTARKAERREPPPPQQQQQQQQHQQQQVGGMQQRGKEVEGEPPAAPLLDDLFSHVAQRVRSTVHNVQSSSQQPAPTDPGPPPLQHALPRASHGTDLAAPSAGSVPGTRDEVAAVRGAGAGAIGTQPDARKLCACLSECLGSLARLRAQGLVDPGEELLCGAIVAARLRLQEFEPEDLVNLLWAVAKLDFHPTPDLLAAACAAAAPALRRRRLTPGHLSSLLWALATLRYHPGATWLSYWLSASLSDMGSFGPYDISQAMRALAVLQPSRSDADPDGATCLGSSRAGARALSLTETTQPTPGGRLQQLQEVWCRAATRQCVRVLRPGACAPQDVCNALWAAVRLGLDPPAGWAARVAEALLGGANPAINTARTVDVVGLTYALARLAPQQQLQKAVAAQGGRRVAQGLGSRAARRTQGQPAPEKEVKQGVLLVGGMRPVECVLAGPVQLQRLLRALVASTWCMCDQDVANTLWALRQLGVEPSQGLARRLGRRLAELARARAVGPQALSMLLWWCAQQHDRHHHAFQDQQQEQEQQREVLLPSKGMLRRLLRATARRAAQFGPQSATVLLLAAARLHMRDALPLVPLPIPSPAPRLLMPRSRRVAVNGGGGGGSIAAAGSAQGAPCSAAAAEAEEGLAVDQPPPLPYEQLLGAVLRAMEAAAASGGGGGSNSFTPRTLPTVLWAVSRLGYRPPEAWMRAVMGHSVQLLPSLSLAERCSLVSSLARLRFQPTPEWLQALVDVTPELKQPLRKATRGNTATRQHRTTRGNGIHSGRSSSSRVDGDAPTSAKRRRTSSEAGRDGAGKAGGAGATGGRRGAAAAGGGGAGGVVDVAPAARVLWLQRARRGRMSLLWSVVGLRRSVRVLRARQRRQQRQQEREQQKGQESP